MKKYLKNFWYQIIAPTIMGILAFFAPAYAQNTESFNVKKFLTAPGQENQPFDIASYIVRIINYLSIIIGSVTFLAIVIAGIMLVTSAGDEGRVTKGKEIITYSIIGLAVALGAYFITNFVQSIFYDVGQ